MVLEEKRRAILALLMNALGELPGRSLSVAQKRLASHMERDGLVIWTRPMAGTPWSRDYQTLKLTKADLVVLKAVTSPPDPPGQSIK